jgi:predicted RNA binding protein YcfA (HicA-like mRNA interferase family)
MNGKQVVSKLKAAGYVLGYVRGSHHYMIKGATKVSVPVHGTKDLKPGTLASIASQSGVDLK